MEKGWVWESKSPCVVPMILVPKKDRSWRMGMDYRPINAIIIRYRHPIPHLDNLLDELHGACIFLKIDLRNRCHQICMREGGKWKTAFNTKLTNTPSTFMRHMNNVLRSLIGRCVVVYFDDILVYSTCLDDHVLQLLKDESMYVKLEKCTFCTQEVIFLGFVMGSQGSKLIKKK
ncbi:hypothetical protein CR513_44576, partial [Mucuna pruriens]